jgi:twitching motility protein PilT
MAKIDGLLRKMVGSGASDLHLSAGEPVRLRIDGELRPVGDKPLSTNALTDIMKEIAPADLWERYLKTNELDLAYSIAGLSRFRCNFLKQLRGVGAVFRVIPEKILTLDQLKVPDAVRRLPKFQSGLVLVTGPTGSGKSTTLAAIIDDINRSMAKHIITVEDPVEFVHPNINSFIIQREVGQHTGKFADALRDALSSDPDVILVGEMRDLETISLAVSAAEMGVLVFGTMHTNSAAKTLNRIIDAFPASRKEQIKGMLSESLRGILSQQLLAKKDGKGRVAAFEIMFSGPGFSNLIREGNVPKIFSYIQANKALGMQTMDAALQDLIKKNMVTEEAAFLKANDKKDFQEWLDRRAPPEDEQASSIPPAQDQ